MKYCKTSTINHVTTVKFNKILIDIYDILKKEGCKLKFKSPFYKKKIYVIDGDNLETLLKIEEGRTYKNKSTDIIFAICDISKIEIQFVELKLNCKDKFYHLDKSSFRAKVNSSKLAIGNQFPFSKKNIIVFNTNVLNQAKNFLFRINPILNNDFVALDVHELYKKFFIIKDE